MRRRPFYIAICDDDDTDRKQIEEMAEEVCRLDKIRAEIFCYETAKALLKDWQNGREYDLFLLDVMMPVQDGIELARRLRNKELESSIVFISNNREMALQGYEVEAVRYLAKPLDPGRMREAIRFCYGKFQNNKELLLSVNGSMRRIMPKNIYYIEIKGRKSRIRQEREEWDTSLSLRELEGMLLGQGFVRCHQSFLVNCRHVKNFRTSTMDLTNGQSVPVSKHRIKEVRQAFFDYMKN